MTLFDLAGKTALVTGGTRGIGMMIARGLLDAGARVAISSRKADACEEARAELAPHGDVVAFPMDVSTEAGCRELAEQVGAWGSLNILVNNAGATWGEPLESFPESAWDKVLNLNLKSPFFLARAVLPMLEAHASQDDPSRIINIGSIDGLHVPQMASTYSYSASKAALHHLTRVLARELGPRHVTVNAVAPGPFESKMMAWTLEQFGDAIAESSPLGRIGRADDMAGVAVFLSSRAGSYVTGAVIPVDGGIATTI